MIVLGILSTYIRQALSQSSWSFFSLEGTLNSLIRGKMLPLVNGNENNCKAARAHFGLYLLCKRLQEINLPNQNKF